MTDVLIRNLPADIVERIDARAGQVGLSRNEFLRREITQLAAGGSAVSIQPADFAKFADLADDEVMRDAWS